MNDLADAVTELVAAITGTILPDTADQHVTPADFMHAAATRGAGGLFPDRPVFTPAVPYRKDR